jgi:hypothetical protein
MSSISDTAILIHLPDVSSPVPFSRKTVETIYAREIKI